MRIHKFMLTITTHSHADTQPYKRLSDILSDALRNGHRGDIERTFYLSNLHLSRKPIRAHRKAVRP